MNRAGVTVLLCMMGLCLAGCGASMRSYLEKDTPTESLNARQDLTMPPDLRLPPPGAATALPDPGVASTPAYAAPKAAAPAVKTAAVTTGDPKDAIYTNVGISVNNPDGTRKTDQQLREELQDYYIAQKKAKNPNYGSIMNIGNIFKDE
ncbi:hypothetical protein [Aestuariivirga sp.]|uniref:hypothetical protein n=1 Tax=Aestuariivirga sp. TaxID=2650926 RepID=UPI0025BA98C5|nr:hypothetical protein [Aestuariivirga sp.]MCA3555421.1 hypothetical protein [Aestuariivirga sp.]